MARLPAARPTPGETRRTTRRDNPEASSANVRNPTTGARASFEANLNEARRFQRLVLSRMGTEGHDTVTELILSFVHDELPLREMVRCLTVLFDTDRDLIIGFNRILHPLAQIPMPVQNLRHRFDLTAVRGNVENPTTRTRISAESDVNVALRFMRLVRTKLGIEVYNVFVALLLDYGQNGLLMPEMVRRVTALFEGDRDLIIGFNWFLHPRARIPVPVQNLREG